MPDDDRTRVDGDAPAPAGQDLPQRGTETASTDAERPQRTEAGYGVAGVEAVYRGMAGQLIPPTTSGVTSNAAAARALTIAPTPNPFEQIRAVALECFPDPNYEDEANDREYNQGWNACWEMYRRVLMAVEHGLICPKCGAPAHRGADRATLDRLLEKRDTSVLTTPPTNAVDPHAADPGTLPPRENDVPLPFDESPF